MKLPEEEIKTILNGIKDFVLIISPEREILEINETFLNQMDYTRDQVIGRKCYDVFKEATRKSSNCHNKCPLEAVVRNKRHCSVELTRLGGDNKLRYAELTIYPVWEKQGKISKFIEISRDVTKRKQNEKETRDYLEKMVEKKTRELKETHKRMLHQDKMASLGKLASSVVHEINNPVAGILNMVLLSKRIMKEDAMDEKARELFSRYLDLMETETRRVSRIVSNLLVFSRQSKIEVIRLDVNELIQQTLILNSNLMQINGITLIEEFEHDLPRIKGSEDQLKQVCMNLISNAVESMAAMENKVLTIKTFSKKEDDAVVVQVMDTGAGIPKDTVSKIFEPFFTTKKEGRGVGLGLSVIYGIINEHGGGIYVDSTPGKGTTFTVTLYREPAYEK